MQDDILFLGRSSVKCDGHATH